MSASQLIVSTESLLELEEVLSRPKFDIFLSFEDRMKFFHKLMRTAVLIKSVPAVAAFVAIRKTTSSWLSRCQATRRSSCPATTICSFCTHSAE